MKCKSQIWWEISKGRDAGRRLHIRGRPILYRAGGHRPDNLAAKEAVGEILWFVDADVIAHGDSPERIRRALADHAVSAVFGSYDNSPPAPAFAAQYKNLTHRYYGLTDDLNVATGERLRAGLAGLFFLSLSLPFLLASLWWAPALATAAVFAANKSFLAFMRARRGVLFAIESLLFHQVYYVYSATAFVFCLLEHHLKFARSSGQIHSRQLDVAQRL